MAGPSDGNKKMTKEPSFASQVQAFDFCGESIDTSLRKLLAKIHLPKEAQQIDRAMEDFAKRYHECNPGLVDSPDAVYAVSFSILLLHTDAHNRNVKNKMNKDTFIMRTKIIEGGESVPHEILDIMYDNIVMSEFTYADGRKELTSRTERSNSWFSKLKSNDSNINIQSAALLADLGTKLEQIMPAENTFSYKRTLKPIPIKEVHFSLLKAKSLCLAGVRSRHHRANDNHNNNTFTIRVTKSGMLDRKYDLIQGGKKATARGWRPFGVILSGSQIVFFADTHSFQSWKEQDENPSNNTSEQLAPRRNNSVPAFNSMIESTPDLNLNNGTISSMSSSIYAVSSNMTLATPSTTSTAAISPIPNFNNTSTVNSYLRPVQIVSLSYAICICDESYTKYPHVFRLITGDGQQFLLRAENDQDMEDWMLKINYAATLKTTDVRMRPTKLLQLHQRPIESARSVLVSTATASGENISKHQSDKLKREQKATEKVQELSDRIDEQVKLLDRELQLRMNLMVLVPFQKSTKDRILLYAETLGKRIKTKRIELQRLECYRDYLECELAWSHHPMATKKPSRKMSLPLPSHVYSFNMLDNNTVGDAVDKDADDVKSSSTLHVGGSKNSQSGFKRLANLVFTAPSDESLPMTSNSSTSTSSNALLEETSSAISKSAEEDEDEEDEEDDGDDEKTGNNHLKLSKLMYSTSSTSDNASLCKENEEEENASSSSVSSSINNKVEPPKLPPFSFPKSFIEGISFMDNKNIKHVADKAMEMDRVIRRRSQSNPILPNSHIHSTTTAVDKKLLHIEESGQKGMGRERSGSEASSVRDDDDDMSVVIVNESDELPNDSTAWSTTTC